MNKKLGETLKKLANRVAELESQVIWLKSDCIATVKATESSISALDSNDKCNMKYLQDLVYVSTFDFDCIENVNLRIEMMNTPIKYCEIDIDIACLDIDVNSNLNCINSDHCNQGWTFNPHRPNLEISNCLSTSKTIEQAIEDGINKALNTEEEDYGPRVFEMVARPFDFDRATLCKVAAWLKEKMAVSDLLDTYEDEDED